MRARAASLAALSRSCSSIWPRRELRERLQHAQVAIVERAIGLEAEAAESAVDAAVAQPDRHAEMRPDRHRAGHFQRGGFGDGGGVGDQLRDASGDDLAAIAAVIGKAVADLDRAVAGGVDVAHHHRVGDEFGCEGDVHPEMRADRLKDAVDAGTARARRRHQSLS